MKIADSSACPCGLGNQTTNHVLLEYPRNEDLRQTILWQNGRETRDMSILLGEPAFAKRAAIFMAGTGLLAGGVMAPQEPPAKRA